MVDESILFSGMAPCILCESVPIGKAKCSKDCSIKPFNIKGAI